MNAWWEGITAIGGYATNQVIVNSHFAALGDLAQNTTYYQLPLGAVNFNWYNVTTGYAEAPISTTIIGSWPTPDFYDGTHGEFIDERSQHSGGAYYNLALAGVLGWEDAYVARAGQPDEYVDTFPLDLVETYSPTGHHLAGAVGGDLSGPGNWNIHILNES
jgi:hypothetical protein